ncbi:hypothetical protein D5086_017441 [Populus alba]|uniref:Uncharacterized protein n=1 Tax=Populus alba TaxID=43335 RepID=A0ACC4BWR5_POPAL
MVCGCLGLVGLPPCGPFISDHDYVLPRQATSTQPSTSPPSSPLTTVACASDPPPILESGPSSHCPEVVTVAACSGEVLVDPLLEEDQVNLSFSDDDSEASPKSTPSPSPAPSTMPYPPPSPPASSSVSPFLAPSIPPEHSSPPCHTRLLCSKAANATPKDTGIQTPLPSPEEVTGRLEAQPTPPPPAIEPPSLVSPPVQPLNTPSMDSECTLTSGTTDDWITVVSKKKIIKPKHTKQRSAATVPIGSSKPFSDNSVALATQVVEVPVDPPCITLGGDSLSTSPLEASMGTQLTSQGQQIVHMNPVGYRRGNSSSTSP